MHILPLRQLTKGDANVFATDVILSSIMCCTRSVHSWDIVVQKIGDKLFFDKRDDSEFGGFFLSSDRESGRRPSLLAKRRLG